MTLVSEPLPRPRSQCDRILEILSDRRWHSHHEFYGWCVLHSRISELRRRGHTIRTRRDGSLYLYRLDPPGTHGLGIEVPA